MDKICKDLNKDQVIKDLIIGEYLKRLISEEDDVEPYGTTINNEDNQLEIIPARNIVESIMADCGIILPKVHKSAPPAYRYPRKLRAATKLITEPKSMMERLSVEIMRRLHGKVENAGIFATPASFYTMALDDGATELVISKGKLKQLLYDHTTDVEFRDSDIGKRAFALVAVPRQLLLDYANDGV